MDRTKSLARLYETTAIPLSIVDENGNPLHNEPHLVKPCLPTRFAELCINDFELQKRDEYTPLVLMVEPSFFIGIARLNSGNYLILGPASPQPLSQSELMNLCEHVIYPEQLLDFCSIMNNTPITPYRRFVSTLSLVVEILDMRQISINDISLCNNTIQHKEAEQQMTHQLFSQREHTVFHTPQSYEAGVLSAVQEGDVETLKRRLEQPVTGRVGQMSKDLLTQERYTFISFVTMVTRAAIRGGLNQETAYALSDSHCQLMDEMSQVQDISVLSYKMAVDFCYKVAEEHGGHNHSSAVEKCLRYISQNLHQEIRLPDLADECGLCTKAISSRFRKEVGYPVAEYIHRQRMKEARYLLKHSQHSILEICGYLQYTSQSYFTKVFNDLYGITPQQYRNEVEWKDYSKT